MDYITEMLTGEPGSIRVPAKIVLMTSHDCEYGKRYGIWGVVISQEQLVHPDSEQWHEMWECELIIIPKRKYKSHKEGEKQNSPTYYFRGMMPNQMLTSGFGDPELWGDQYFGNPIPHNRGE
jgi:hypothetical protein